MKVKMHKVCQTWTRKKSWGSNDKLMDLYLGPLGQRRFVYIVMGLDSAHQKKIRKIFAAAETESKEAIFRRSSSFAY
ncbi:hypothetical protein YC2023_119826 [Brassica napus]